MKRNHSLLLWGLLLCLWAVSACQTTAVVPTPSPSPSQVVLTATPSTTLALPTATPPPPDTGWRDLQPGLSERQITLRSDSNGRVLETAYIVRLNPELWRFDIAYRPGQPQTLDEWQAETGAAIVVNGGYFTPEQVATGLIITEGTAQGVSYGDFAGMLTIDTAGVPTLRWLATRPYRAGEDAWAGLQSFPMLVKPGGELGFPADADSGSQARRTAVGQDRVGRLYFIVTPRGYFTLHELSRFLTASDLDLDVAFNLDGGPSSGMLVRGGTDVPAFSRLPAVITVTAR